MLTLDGDEWSASYNNLFHFWGKSLQYPLKRAVWVPEPVWTLWRRETSLDRDGFEISWPSNP